MARHEGEIVRDGGTHLGDVVQKSLSLIGITSERISRWLGRPCGCKERRDKLNQLDAWARRVIFGKTPEPPEEHKQHLESLLAQPETPSTEVSTRPSSGQSVQLWKP